MELIQHVIEYKSRTDVFPIWYLGDIHAGVVHCDEDLLDKEVRKIRDTRNARWVGMGDYGDCITPSDFKRWEGRILAPWMKGHEDNIGPTQVRRVNEILSPIWNKCLGLIEGNHDEDIRKYTHYNFMEELLLLARKKGDVPYGGVSCFVEMVFKRIGQGPDEANRNRLASQQIIMHCRHGEGSARTSGARALAVLRLAQTFVNCHIVASGHLHGQESPDLPERLICSRGKIKAFNGLAFMTGAWLKAYAQGVPPCYLERWGTQPSKLGCPRVLIEPDKERMTLEKVSRITNLTS